MMDGQKFKIISVTPPQVIVDNASYTTGEIDTVGFSYLVVVAYLGATDIAMTALAVTESDTAGSGHANVTGLIYGTSLGIGGSASTLPSATDDNKFFSFEIDLKGRKRFIDVTATMGDGTVGGYLTIFALGFKRQEALSTPAQRGFSQILRV